MLVLESRSMLAAIVCCVCLAMRANGQSSSIVRTRLIQVKMGPFVNCSAMTESSKFNISLLIKKALAIEINDQCHCSFPISKLTGEQFHCNNDTSYYPTYRVMIGSQGDYSAADLAGFVNSWISTSPSVTDGIGTFSVDSSCPVYPNIMDDPACPESDSENPDVVLLIGVALAEFVVLLVAFSVVVAGILIYTNRQIKRMNRFKRRRSRKRLVSAQSNQSSESYHHPGVRMHSCEAYAAV